MKMTGNTILVTGGGSGIGRGLAEAFHRLGNQVIIAGRGRNNLDDATSANAGMTSLTVDMTDAGSIAAFAARVADDHPALNVLVNAGIMVTEDLLEQRLSLLDAEAIVMTNLLGPIRLIAALLPTLRRQPRSTIVNVSSGLAFVPMAMTPTYCATKAAIHSYTQSFRHQLGDTTTAVTELIPPYMATGLMGGASTNDPNAMPLDAFIAEAIGILRTQPDATEICVERVHPLRTGGGKPGAVGITARRELAAGAVPRPAAAAGSRAAAMPAPLEQRALEQAPLEQLMARVPRRRLPRRLHPVPRPAVPASPGRRSNRVGRRRTDWRQTDWRRVGWRRPG